MRTLIRTLLFFFFVFAVSCSKNKESKPIDGTIEFALNVKKSLKSNSSQDSPAISHIIVTIEGHDGVPVYTSEKVELLSFGNEYISYPLSLAPGTYKLTKFMVLDINGNVVYACPKAGSEQAYLVNQPLDIRFEINEDEVTKLLPEVIKTESSTPSAFGYFDASFQLVKTFDFLIAVFVYDESQKNYKLTESAITISGDSAELYTIQLGNQTTKVSVNDKYSIYMLSISKTGYENYISTFSTDSLKACFSKPLVIILKKSETSLDITNGLVAYYPFNGNANDESVSKINGAIHGCSYVSDHNQQPNSAISLDKTKMDNVSFGYDNRNITKEVSLCIWFKTTLELKQMIVCKYDWENDAGYHLVIDALGKLIFAGRNRYNNAYQMTDFSKSKLNDGQWHFAVGTGDAHKWQLYIDGELDNEVYYENPNSDFSNSQPFVAGYFPRGVSGEHFYFNGQLDEISLYNRVLTKDEIKFLFENSK